MKSSKMFVWNSQFKKYAMLHINCNRDIKNYVSSDHILQMFTLLNVDFETASRWTEDCAVELHMH